MTTDADWLRREYLERGRSQRDIADECGVTDSTVARWLDAHGVKKTKPVDHLAVSAEWLFEEYVLRRRSIVDLAAELGIAPTTMRRTLADAGIEIRTGRRPAVLDDRDWCARNLHRGIDVIAAELECRPELVRRAMQGHRLVPKSKGRSPYWQLADEEWLRERYIEDGMTHQQVADLIGCSRNAVTQALHRHGIRSRPTKGPQYPELHDPDWMARVMKARGSMAAVAREIGCDPVAVTRALERFGLR